MAYRRMYTFSDAVVMNRFSNDLTKFINGFGFRGFIRR